MKQTTFLSLCFLICWNLSYAQQSIQLSPPEIPPAPEAATLGKFGDIPVNLSSGSPSVNIPLHTIQAKDITIPIALTYHAGGIKVEDVASRTGLGWALQAGGVITRSVRGIPDDAPFGYWNSPRVPTKAEVGEANVKRFDSYFTHLEAGQADADPDVFTFNFGGQSGQFIVDQHKQAFGIPKNDFKIIVPETANGICKSFRQMDSFISLVIIILT